MTVQPGTPFAKRYLKYLTKKYMQREGMRNFMRVLANPADRHGFDVLLYHEEEENGEEGENKDEE